MTLHLREDTPLDPKKITELVRGAKSPWEADAGREADEALRRDAGGDRQLRDDAERSGEVPEGRLTARVLTFRACQRSRIVRKPMVRQTSRVSGAMGRVPMFQFHGRH